MAEYERRLLEELIIDSFTERDFAKGRGSFLTRSWKASWQYRAESVAIITRDEDLKAIVLADREEFLKVIVGFLLERQKSGEIREDADVGVLA